MIVEFHFDDESNYRKLEKLKNNYGDYFDFIQINQTNLVFVKKHL